MWSPVVPHLPNLVRAFNGIVPVVCPAHSSSIVKDWLQVVCSFVYTWGSSCLFACTGVQCVCSCIPRILNHWDQSFVQISWQFLSRWQKSCPSRKHRRSQTRRTTPVEEKPACHFLDRGLFKKETICARPVPRGHQDFFSHLNGHHRSSQALFKLNEEQMHLKLSWFVLLDLTYSK